jgi:hypothetical protein
MCMPWTLLYAREIALLVLVAKAIPSCTRDVEGQKEDTHYPVMMHCHSRELGLSTPSEG